MRKNLTRMLILLTIIALLPANAFAAKASINLGGKVGFMYEGSSVTLRPKLKNVSQSSLIWESSDEEVATVFSGKITAGVAGRTVITVSGNGAKARCGVVVLPRSVTLQAGSTLSLPYGTVEKYTMKNTSIATISKKGEIYGKKAGTTYLRVRYGRQTLYVQVNVTAETVQQSKAAQLDCADQTDQIILVEYEKGSKATLTIHEKKSGVWQQLYSTTAYLGRNGIDKTREGDGKTPTGTYNLTQAFGIKSDPGANLPYTKVTKYHYWCGSSGSDYYNQLVDTRVVNRKRTSSDEYLINYKGYYDYCVFIDYNAEGQAGKGSCIFLHCKGGKDSTAGCIAVDAYVMKNIVRWLQPGAKIVIQ